MAVPPLVHASALVHAPPYTFAKKSQVFMFLLLILLQFLLLLLHLLVLLLLLLLLLMLMFWHLFLLLLLLLLCSCFCSYSFFCHHSYYDTPVPLSYDTPIALIPSTSALGRVQPLSLCWVLNGLLLLLLLLLLLRCSCVCSYSNFCYHSYYDTPVPLSSLISTPAPSPACTHVLAPPGSVPTCTLACALTPTPTLLLFLFLLCSYSYSCS